VFSGFFLIREKSCVFL
jgi:hypothetical protein